MKKRILSLFLAVLMVCTVIPFAGMRGLFTTAEATKIKDLPTSDFVRFGSYPQDRVTDTGLLSKLNAAIGNFDSNPNKKSMDCYAGNNNDGSAAIAPGMINYIDFTYNNEKYRAVKLNQWRPRNSCLPANVGNSFQDENGFSLGMVYFFRFTELYWEILDKANGLLVCDSVIDAQPFTGTYHVINKRFVRAAVEYPNMYANAFMISDINSAISSQYIENSFYNVAFDAAQKKQLGTVSVSEADGNGKYDNSGYYYPVGGLSYNVGLLSVEDIATYKNKFTAQVGCSEYAKCMGMTVNSGGSSYWLCNRHLTDPGNKDFSKQACFFRFDGTKADASRVDTILGVRPVIKINGDFDLTEIEVKFNSTFTAGTQPSDPVAKPAAFSDAHYTVRSIEWKTGAGSFSATVPTLQADTTYTMRLHLNCDTGWLFANNLKVNTSGSSLKPTKITPTGTQALIEYEFKIPAKQPTYGFAVGWAIPKLGKALEHQAANYSYSTGPSGGVQYFNVTEKWTKNGSIVAPGTVLTNGTYTVEVDYSVKATHYMVENFVLNERVSSYWAPDGKIELSFDASKGTAKAKASYTISDTVSYLNLVVPQTPLPGNTVNTYSKPSAKDAAGNWIAGNDSIVKVDGFWYEGKNINNPTDEQKLVAGTDKFQKGKTYTYRFFLTPNSGYKWSSSTPVFKLNGTEKSPSKLFGFSGTYTVDFTYEAITDQIGSISLANATHPANGAGFKTDPALASRSQNSYYVNLVRGWYDKPDGAIVGIPQVGETYYMMITLSAQEGYSFSPNGITLDLYETDWQTKVSYEKQESKTITRNWDNDTLILYVGIKCEEIHILKNSVRDIDTPKIGQKLDTDVNLVATMAQLAFVSYFINGEKVIDPDLKPSAGDVVDIYIGIKPLGAAVFDEDIYLTWVFDNDSVNSRRSYRDYSLGVPDDIAVFTQRITMPYSGVPEDVTLLNFTNSTQPANGTKATSNVSSDALDKIQLVNNGEWLYDLGSDKSSKMDTSESFKTGTDYALAVKFKMRDGFNLASNCTFTLTDKNNTPVNIKKTSVKKDGNTYTVYFFTTGIAKTPLKTITAIILNNVTQPVVGEQIGDTKLGDNLAFESVDIPEPEKYYISGYRGSYWYRTPDYDTFNEIKFGETFKEGTSYGLIIRITIRPGYQLADGTQIRMYDENGIEVDYHSSEHGKANANGEIEFRIFFSAPVKKAPTEAIYYTVVKNGTKTPSGYQPAGTKITITANAAPAGQEFYRWVVEKGGVYIDNITKATASFTMRSENVTIRAVYRNKGAATHSIKVTSGTANPTTAAKGAIVTVAAAAAPTGKVFDKWEVVKGGITLKNASAAATTFTMGDTDVELKAIYKAKIEGEEKFKLGDVDNNGKINATDARLALRAAVKLEPFWNQPDGQRFKSADVDKDHKITANDARKILRAAVKLEDPAKW